MDFERGSLRPEIDISYLKGRVNVETLLEDLGVDISHREKGWIMCHCPNWLGNHRNGDANPSFGFDDTNLKYNCFVCGGGSAVDLIQILTGKTEQGAVEVMEEHATFQPSEKSDLLAKVNAIMHPMEEKELTPDYSPEALFQYRKIHPYLYERGITKEVIVDMQVGFDADHYGIIIPHFFMGKLVGWQCRHLLVEDGVYHCQDALCNQPGKKVAKYKNTPGFPKNNTLYNYDKFKEFMALGTCDSVIVVESPFTALYLKSLGFENVVATFGQFSREQGMLLLAVPKVYFWPDNDKAGFENAERAIESMSKFNRVFIVPVVKGEKSDAANIGLDDINKHLEMAYSAALWPIYKLSTVADLRARTTV